MELKAEMLQAIREYQAAWRKVEKIGTSHIQRDLRRAEEKMLEAIRKEAR